MQRTMPARSRVVLRAVRAAAAFEDHHIAAAVGAKAENVAIALGHMNPRGVCDTVAAHATRGDHRLCPPPLRRLWAMTHAHEPHAGDLRAATQAQRLPHAGELFAAAGAAMWAARHAACANVVGAAEASLRVSAPAGALRRVWGSLNFDTMSLSAFDHAGASPVCPPAVLAALVNGSSGIAAKAVAANRACPPDVLENAATHRLWVVRAAAAAHRRCPGVLFEGLVADFEVLVAAAAAANAACTEPAVRFAAARTADSGGRFADRVRAAAATNPGCPPDVLERLAAARSPMVAAAAGSNVACPPEGLERLAVSEHTEARAAAASNPSCPPDVLKRLGDDSWVEVTQRAAANHACPPELLERFAHRPSVAAQALSNPSCPRSVVVAAATDRGLWRRRLAAASNPACPSEVLAELVNDQDPKVAAKARQTVDAVSVTLARS